MIKLRDILSEVQIGVKGDKVFKLWLELYHNWTTTSKYSITAVLDIFGKYGYYDRDNKYIGLEDWLATQKPYVINRIYQELINVSK
jgi:hypothetical protein